MMRILREMQFVLLLVISVNCFGQAHKPGSIKMPGTLRELKSSDKFLISIKDPVEFNRKYKNLLITPSNYDYNILTGFNSKNYLDSLLADPNVLFIAPARKPKEESVINGFDLSNSRANLSQVIYPDINGNGTHVSIKERLMDTTDIDYRDRFIKTTNAATSLLSHATIMSTIAVGAGNTHYTGRGIATAANLSSASFDNLLPEPDALYKQYNITVQNHSYGTAIENYYGADANAYDNSVINNLSLLHVFSAGNSGTQTSTTGTYKDVTAFANLTGSFKQSKNSLSVGGIDSFYNIISLSSKGPAYDGRIKPELVSYGEDGSSGAAALVSGTALLIQQAYKQQNNILPDAALTKAVIINSAEDIGKPNVDFETGFGSLNTYKAVKTIKENNILNGTISNGNNSTFPLIIPANTSLVKITLCWTDPAAQTNANKALVNDLDLEFINTNTNEKWLPWVLSAVADNDSLNALAVRRKDSLNNVEQVTITNPVAGNYQLSVKGFTVTGNQKFYIAYQFEQVNSFQFTYPAKADNLQPVISNAVRWDAKFSNGTTGNLQLSYDEGATWNTVAANVDLSKPYTKIALKDTNSLGLLRMQINNVNYVSDTFTISSKPDLKIGFNCGDSVMLYWNKLKGINQYQLFKLVNGTLQTLTIANDTTIVLKNQLEKYLSVVPLLKNKTGYKSFATNYTTQGVGCYVNNFIVDRIDSISVQLKATLGANVGTKTISFLKIETSGTKVLKTYTNINAFFYDAFDVSLTPGVNTYRLKIELNNGNIVFSDVVLIYQYVNKQFIVFPNPVKAGQPISLLSNDFDQCIFKLYTLNGKQLSAIKITQEFQNLTFPFLQKGMYLYKIFRKGVAETSGKIIVQ
jgi:hypothetical protein